MVKKISCTLFFLFISCTAFTLELKNFRVDNIDYQWDRKDKRDEALRVYVRVSIELSRVGFRGLYRALQTSGCRREKLSRSGSKNNRWLVALDGDKVVGVAIFELKQLSQHLYPRTQCPT